MNKNKQLDLIDYIQKIDNIRVSLAKKNQQRIIDAGIKIASKKGWTKMRKAKND